MKRTNSRAILYSARLKQVKLYWPLHCQAMKFCLLTRKIILIACMAQTLIKLIASHTMNSLQFWKLSRSRRLRLNGCILIVFPILCRKSSMKNFLKPRTDAQPIQTLSVNIMMLLGALNLCPAISLLSASKEISKMKYVWDDQAK